MAEAEQEAWREEVFSLITLATHSFPETGRARRGKRCNKERMNGRMKERERADCWELVGAGQLFHRCSSMKEVMKGWRHRKQLQRSDIHAPVRLEGSGSKSWSSYPSKQSADGAHATHPHPHPRPAGAHSSWGRRAEPPPEAWFETPQQTALPPLRKRFIPTGSVLHKSSTRTGCKNVRS